MLFRQKFFAGLTAGSIALAFRRWKRPNLKAGTELKKPVGILHFDAIGVTDPAQKSRRPPVPGGHGRFGWPIL
jgi:hypothetical protein